MWKFDHRWHASGSLFALVSALSLLAACGSDEHATPTAACGNGRLDPGEICDDGNLVDGDVCPSNCNAAAVGFKISANLCPEVQELTGSPLGARIGEDIALWAAAVDPEGDELSYDWTGMGGRIFARSSSLGDATYRCAYAGSYRLTLWVFDGHGCVEQEALDVECN